MKCTLRNEIPAHRNSNFFNRNALPVMLDDDCLLDGPTSKINILMKNTHLFANQTDPICRHNAPPPCELYLQEQ